MPAPKSIEEQLAELAAVVAEQGKRLDAQGAVFDALRAVFVGGGSEDVAKDADLDGPKGDEKLRFNPRDWKGAPRKGWSMSRCEPDCLDAYAEQCDYFARREDEKGEKDARGNPKSRWSRLSARRARGWSRRLRAGWKPPEGASSTGTSQGGAWGGGGGWGRPGNAAPQAGGSAAVDDPYAPRGDDQGDAGDDEIPFLSSANVSMWPLRRHPWERL